MRFAGPLVALLLAGLCWGLRSTADARAERLLEGERRSFEVLLALHAEARLALRAGERPGLDEIAGRAGQDGLTTLGPTDREERSFVADQDAVYGLGYVRHRATDTTPARDGFVIRSWPRQYGVTGDLERHVDNLGNFHEGQNTRGRSGTERDFPPPFPEPDLDVQGGRWWVRPWPPDQRP